MDIPTIIAITLILIATHLGAWGLGVAQGGYYVVKRMIEESSKG